MSARFNLILAAFTCSVTLLLSVVPGVLNDFLVFIAIASLWLLLVIRLAVDAIALWFKRKEPTTRTAFRRFIVTLLIPIVSYGLLTFYLPRRIAFNLSRPAFEQWLAENPTLTNKPRSINTQLGIYKVDEYASELPSGHYFRVYSHGDGLGPDTVSYGFAYQPNPEKSPFGAAYYTIYPLGNQWYWFQASNDW